MMAILLRGKARSTVLPLPLPIGESITMLEPIAIAIVEHEGHYLVGQRAEGSALGGLCEFPGGKIHPGESPVEAAVRECAEETGLEVAACRLIDKIVHAYDHATVELFFFQCRLRSQQQANPPRPPFAWLTAEELAQREFPPANAPVIRRLTEPTHTPTIV